MDLHARFLTFARERCRFDPGEGAVVAFSGGADLTALLDLFLRVAGGTDRVVAAHLDHGIRPSSADDASLAGERAAALGARVVVRRVDVPALPSRGALGMEGAAREARYRFLEEVARTEGLPVVATGHHLDDQAETVFLRVLRGTGSRGLRAVLPERPVAPSSSVRVVRPLLAVTRAEILEYLRVRGLEHSEDETNTDGSNLRGVVRSRVLPAIARGVPDLVPRLAAVAESAARLPAPRVTEDAPAPTPLPAAFPPLLLTCPGEVGLPDGRRLVARGDDGALPSADPLREVVDPSRAPPPYEVRPARPRDCFRPLGRDAETTVNQFLKSQRVPAAERAAFPIVCSEGRVVWVVGHRIDERVGVRPGTRGRVVLETTLPS